MPKMLHWMVYGFVRINKWHQLTVFIVGTLRLTFKIQIYII